jgi:hypothetical protein
MTNVIKNASAENGECSGGESQRISGENAMILDDGGNPKAFSRMGPIRPLRWRRITRTRLCSAPPRRTFFSYQGDPSLLAGVPACAVAGEVGFSLRSTEKLSG